jgi:hypothetical protein
MRPSDRSNLWDNGYLSGGNYWSDYFGMDEKAGADQNEPGSDGLGDTPHEADADRSINNRHTINQVKNQHAPKRKARLP